MTVLFLFLFLFLKFLLVGEMSLGNMPLADLEKGEAESTFLYDLYFLPLWPSEPPRPSCVGHWIPGAIKAERWLSILKNNSESTLKFFSSCREKRVTAEASGNMSGAGLKEARVKRETCKNQSEPWGVRFCPQLGKLYFLHTPLVASFSLSLELLPADLLFYCLLFCSNLGSCI